MTARPLSPETRLGRGWALPVHPDPEDGIATVAGELAVAQSIWTILATAPGERVGRPDFGCGIHELVFSAANEWYRRGGRGLRASRTRAVGAADRRDCRRRPVAAEESRSADPRRLPSARCAGRLQPGVPLLPRGRVMDAPPVVDRDVVARTEALLRRYAGRGRPAVPRGAPVADSCMRSPTSRVWWPIGSIVSPRRTFTRSSS